MRTGLIVAVVLLILLGGTAMGIASLLLLPLVGGVFLIVLLVWALQRRAQRKPPMP
jgi:uncharacterized membrane-anchored protein